MSEPTWTDNERRAQFIAGLRELADWLDAHPEAPIPPYPDLNWSVGCLGFDDDSGVAYVCNLAATLGTQPQLDDCGYARVDRQFGSIRYGASYVPRTAMAAYHAALSYDGAVQPEPAAAR